MSKAPPLGQAALMEVSGPVFPGVEKCRHANDAKFSIELTRLSTGKNATEYGALCVQTIADDMLRLSNYPIECAIGGEIERTGACRERRLLLKLYLKSRAGKEARIYARDWYIQRRYAEWCKEVPAR